jgi:hypothetical protein
MGANSLAGPGTILAPSPMSTPHPATGFRSGGPVRGATSQEFHTGSATTTALPPPQRCLHGHPRQNSMDVKNLVPSFPRTDGRHADCSRDHHARPTVGCGRRAITFPYLLFSLTRPGFASSSNPSFSLNPSLPLFLSPGLSALAFAATHVGVNLAGSAGLQWRAPRFPRGRATAFLWIRARPRASPRLSRSLPPSMLRAGCGSGPIRGGSGASSSPA